MFAVLRVGNDIMTVTTVRQNEHTHLRPFCAGWHGNSCSHCHHSTAFEWLIESDTLHMFWGCCWSNTQHVKNACLVSVCLFMLVYGHAHEARR